MAGSPPTLLDEASARLPLFDGLPVGAVDRLAAGGFGRGLLTAALRARLRKGGFVDMGALALASPAALMTVRKVGPVRVGAIRAHVLGELARLVPGARAEHVREATDRRRLDRLRAVPAEPIPLDGSPAERLGRGGATWADLDGIVSALAFALQPDPPRTPPVAVPMESDAVQETRVRAELLRERDREWDEAAPVTGGEPSRRRRAS